MSREDFIVARAAAKRQAVLDSARKRFAADGFDRASMEAIADDASVSTATLYRQFPSKLELFAAVLQRGADDFASTLAARAVADPTARIDALAVDYALLLDEPDSIGMLRAAFAATPSHPAIASLFYERVKTVVGGAFHGAVAAGVSARILAPTEDPLLPGAHLMGMIEHGVLWRRLLSGEPGDKQPDVLAKYALAAFWRAYGMAAR